MLTVPADLYDSMDIISALRKHSRIERNTLSASLPHIPEARKARIFSALISINVIEAVRGRYGGYSLTLEAYEKDLLTVLCAIHPCPTPAGSDHRAMISTAIKRSLRSIKLADLFDEEHP